MKKTYIAPTLEEQKIELHHIICVSGTLDPTQNITDPSEFGARSLDFLGDGEY